MTTESKLGAEKVGGYAVGQETKRQALVDTLKAITSQEMDEMLGSREVDHEAVGRPDFIWHFLLQSFATMGNTRGWDGLIGNADNYGRVTFDALSGLDHTERLKRLDEVLRAAKVRMPGKKEIWLNHNYEMITEMGGLEEIRRQALAQEGIPHGGYRHHIRTHFAFSGTRSF